LNLYAPMFMATSTNALIAANVSAAVTSIACYCACNLVSKALSELQSVVYLKVKQTAYVEIATMTYEHLHSLSLDWHLKKKLGDVLRSMDRGVESANSVVSYLFLYLVPTMLECVIVMIIFATHFQLASISFVSFLALVAYAYVTIHLTLWRKKFRQESTKHDNEYHDKGNTLALYLSFYLSFFLSFYLSIVLSIYLSLYLSIYLSLTHSLYHSILCVCVGVSFFPS
jgi:ABC-type bacteriocin/lantibiotic exporter with double-glycine peptidase domain